MLRVDTWNNVFCQNPLNFEKRIPISLNDKGKPEKSFNTAKNQEFELIASCHFKILISSKPTRTVSGV